MSDETRLAALEARVAALEMVLEEVTDGAVVFADTEAEARPIVITVTKFSSARPGLPSAGTFGS